MLYGVLIMCAAGAEERKFLRAASRMRVICWLGLGLAALLSEQREAYRPVSIRMTSHDYGPRYLKLIMCQLSGSTLSARCRPTGR